MRAWAAMVNTAETPGEAMLCVKQVLRIQPDNTWARQRLARLEQGVAEPDPSKPPQYSKKRIGSIVGRSVFTADTLPPAQPSPNEQGGSTGFKLPSMGSRARLLAMAVIALGGLLCAALVILLIMVAVQDSVP
jgi:hypothetical protein